MEHRHCRCCYCDPLSSNLPSCPGLFNPMPSRCIPLPYFRPLCPIPFSPHLPYSPLYSSPSPILPITFCPETCSYNPYFPLLSICSKNSYYYYYHYTPLWTPTIQPPSFPHSPQPIAPTTLPPRPLSAPLQPGPFPVGIPHTPAYSVPGPCVQPHKPITYAHPSPFSTPSGYNPSPLSSHSPKIFRPLLSSQHLLPAPNPEVSITSWFSDPLPSSPIPFTSIALITLDTHPTPCLLLNIVLEHLWPSIPSTASKTLFSSLLSRTFPPFTTDPITYPQNHSPQSHLNCF